MLLSERWQIVACLELKSVSDRVESRLSALEDAIYELRQQRVVASSPSRSGRQHAHIDQSQCSHTPSTGHAVVPEGAASFGWQTLQASQVTELASSEASQSPAVMLELVNLRSMTQGRVEFQRAERDNLLSPNARPSYGKQLPPLNFVLQVLRELRDLSGGQALLFTFYGMRDYRQVEDLCKRVLFPIEPPSAAEVTLLNGMLSIILRELSLAPYCRLEAEELAYHRGNCERNFQGGVETYDVM
ncbi:hypothetical protein S7711_10313, partial [Stachybotrys chartarum IBT 7711]